MSNKAKNRITSVDRLCTQCGLCCDGVIFDDLELCNEAEAKRLEDLGLEVDRDDESVMVQPCAALDKRRCTIYEYRPECCRTFECGLLQKTILGQIDPKDAEAAITKVVKHSDKLKALCIQAGETETELPLKERCGEALARVKDNGVRRRLERALEKLEALVNETFLTS